MTLYDRCNDRTDLFLRTPDAYFTSTHDMNNTTTHEPCDDLHSFGHFGNNDHLSPPFSISLTPLFLTHKASPALGSPEFQSNFSYACQYQGGISPASRAPSGGLALAILDGDSKVPLFKPDGSLTGKEDSSNSSNRGASRPHHDTYLGSGLLTPSLGYQELYTIRSPNDFDVLDVPMDEVHHRPDCFSSQNLFLETPVPAQPGFIADINMFDQNEEQNDLFVRPQDLLGEIPRSPFVDESPLLPDNIRSPTKREQSPVLRPAFPFDETGQEQNACHQDCLDQLPLLVEQYLQKFAPSLPDESKPSVHLSAPRVPEPLPYSPITTELLAAVEEPISLPRGPVRKKLRDVTNDPLSNKARGDVGMNLMHLYDMPIPEDIAVTRAHEGVSGHVVAQKTKYYMMTHPGSRLSEDLLFTFAGRLSTTGIQISGYRCYVSGCTKATKRKDHMGDHIRTHLGEKPYLCRDWYVEVSISNSHVH